jgi:hypothetical protein
MLMAAEWGTGEVLWTMLWFFLWMIWIWMLVMVFSDIFRSPDLGGWGKALLTVFVLVLPYLGVFVYLIARGGRMHEHRLAEVQAQDAAFRAYVAEASENGANSASQIADLAELRNRGVISDAEFEQGKAKALR